MVGIGTVLGDDRKIATGGQAGSRCSAGCVFDVGLGLVLERGYTDSS